MDDLEKVSRHYRHGSLLSAIRDGLEKQGLKPESADIDDLGPVDEFHIGGRIATTHFMDQLEMSSSQKILDVGCGLGGSARFAAKTYGVQIVGIDLTPEYIDTGRVLCDWVGLSQRIQLQHGSALSLPYDDRAFDGAYMMHVGMNIEDKHRLFTEVSRVLKPGSKFGIYDIMKTSEDELIYPVPWATTSETSWLASAETYQNTLETCGFAVTAQNDRHDFAVAFFKTLKEAAKTTDGPPPLGLHVLMQQSTAEKIPNMVANLTAGRISPVEMIAVKEDR